MHLTLLEVFTIYQAHCRSWIFLMPLLSRAFPLFISKISSEPSEASRISTSTPLLFLKKKMFSFLLLPPLALRASVAIRFPNMLPLKGLNICLGYSMFNKRERSPVSAKQGLASLRSGSSWKCSMVSLWEWKSLHHLQKMIHSADFRIFLLIARGRVQCYKIDWL